MSLDTHTIGLLIARPVDRALLAEFLVDSGYRVVERAPGDATHAEWERVSLVLVDARTARTLRPALLALKRERAAFLPIVVALRPPDPSLEWLRAGFDDVLRLPVSKLELAARLRVCLRYREHSVEQHRIEHSRLEEILRQMPAGVIIADVADGTVLFENEQMEAIWGRPRPAAAALENYTARKGFHADGTPYTPDRWPLARSIRDGEVVSGEEIEIERGDGSRATVLVSSAAIREAGRRPVSAVATYVDITERKKIDKERERLLVREQQAREEAERANRLKDEFLATVSHELRTPLNAIIGWLHLLESGHVDATTRKRALATIARNAHTQAQIVADLLDISRIRTGKLQMEFAPVDLLVLVKDVIETLNPAALGKRIRIRTHADVGLPVVLGDADRLRQVIWNLLSNAVKFSSEGARVDVRLVRGGDHVEIVVSDTGQGISPDFLPYVFDRFRQADGSSTRAHGGLGLGLSIVREIVALHGGTVTASSPGKGQGATFVVQLFPAPAGVDVPASTPPTFAQGDGAPQDSSRLVGKRILVVEDQPDSLEMLELILQGCGAVTQGCSSVEEALEAFDGFGPDVIVADIGLPGENGFDLIRRVRAFEAGTGRSRPAVALTAFTGEKDRRRALAEGFHLHVVKPVDPVELVTAIEGLLDGAAT